MTVSRSDDQSLGQVLRQLRQRRGLTGQQAAKLVGMSQPKISRIENGRGSSPSVDDVRRLAEALGADVEQVDQLLTLARRMHEATNEWPVIGADSELDQRDAEQVERAAISFKVFQPAVVVGLLQTSEYAEAVLTSLRFLHAPSGAETISPSVYGAVSARVHRQQVLSDPGKRFDFVMAEAVLSNRLCAPEDMLAQISRISRIAQQENVSIGIVRSDAVLRMPLFHGFSVLDDRHLFIELFDSGLAPHDETEAAFYGTVFAAIREQADYDIEPILKKHRERYLRELSAE